MSDLPVYRLYLLRAYYALIACGTMVVFWPSLLHHSATWGIDNGAQYSLLAAMSPLFLLGLRYPVRMLPLIIYEFLWKALWFVFVFRPLWVAGQTTDQVWANAFACGMSIVLTPIVVPWHHLWQAYAVAPADRWSGTIRGRRAP